MAAPDPDPREDVYLLAALLSEVERVLHPLPRGMRGRVRPQTVFPPSLPTPEGPGPGRGSASGADGGGGIRGSGAAAMAGTGKEGSADGTSRKGRRVDSPVPDPGNSVTADSGILDVLRALRLDTPVGAFEQGDEVGSMSLPSASGRAQRRLDVGSARAADAGDADRTFPREGEPGPTAISRPAAVPVDAMGVLEDEPGGSMDEQKPGRRRSPRARPETRGARSSQSPFPDRCDPDSNQDFGVAGALVRPDRPGRHRVSVPDILPAESANPPAQGDRLEQPPVPAVSPLDGAQESSAAESSGALHEPPSRDRAEPRTVDEGGRRRSITDLAERAEEVLYPLPLHRFEPPSTDSLRRKVSGLRGAGRETLRDSVPARALEPGLLPFPTPDSELGAWVAAGARIGATPEEGAGLPASSSLGPERPRVPAEPPLQGDRPAGAREGDPAYAYRSVEECPSLDDREIVDPVADAWEADDVDLPFMSFQVADRFWRLSRSELRRIDERLSSGFLDRALLRRR